MWPPPIFPPPRLVWCILFATHDMTLLSLCIQQQLMSVTCGQRLAWAQQ